MFFCKQAPGTQRETTGELESLLSFPKRVSEKSALSKDTHHETCQVSAQVAAACAYCFGMTPRSRAEAGFLYACDIIIGHCGTTSHWKLTCRVTVAEGRFTRAAIYTLGKQNMPDTGLQCSVWEHGAAKQGCFKQLGLSTSNILALFPVSVVLHLCGSVKCTESGLPGALVRTESPFGLNAVIDGRYEGGCAFLRNACFMLNQCLRPCRNMEIVRLWLPVNVIFVGMIWSSFSALRNLGVPMATVLKNMANVFTICGDYAFYGKVYGAGVWASLALICVSAICGSMTDLAFDLEGYMWQLMNCLFTAFYSLYLRGVMDRVVPLTVKKSRLDEFSMVFYNNFLSLPLLMVLIWWHDELHAIIHDPALRDPSFIMTACASALVAFGISFASLWFLSTTTATTFSLVGSLNKIPIAVIGLFAFNTPWNLKNAASIAVGLTAGIVFVKAKLT